MYRDEAIVLGSDEEDSLALTKKDLAERERLRRKNQKRKQKKKRSKENKKIEAATGTRSIDPMVEEDSGAGDLGDDETEDEDVEIE